MSRNQDGKSSSKAAIVPLLNLPSTQKEPGLGFSRSSRRLEFQNKSQLTTSNRLISMISDNKRNNTSTEFLGITNLDNEARIEDTHQGSGVQHPENLFSLQKRPTQPPHSFNNRQGGNMSYIDDQDSVLNETSKRKSINPLLNFITQSQVAGILGPNVSRLQNIANLMSAPP